MPNYETLEGFKKKLKSGSYDNATGARRAIGKMRTWEETDKDAARKAVDRHFGSEPVAKAAPKAATAKKVVKAEPAKAAKTFERKKRPEKKKATKKAAAAPAQKSAPIPAKVGDTVVAPMKAATMKAPAKKAPAKSRERKPVEKAAAPESGLQTRIQNYTNMIALYTSTADVLKGCASTEVNVTAGLELVSSSVSRLLSGMDAQLVAPLTGAPLTAEEAKALERLVVSAPSPASFVPPRVVPPPMPPGINGAGSAQA